MTTQEIQILGFTEEQSTCDRCGRSELKGTYAIDVNGAILYLGSSCIAHRFEMTKSEVTKFITSEKKRIDKEKRAKILKIQLERIKATEGLNMLNNYDLFMKIAKPFDDEINKIKKS